MHEMNCCGERDVVAPILPEEGMPVSIYDVEERRFIRIAVAQKFAVTWVVLCSEGQAIRDRESEDKDETVSRWRLW